MNPQKVKTSVGMETPSETMKRAEAMLPTPKQSNTTPVITPETLSPTPVINVPTPPVPTQGPALQGEIQASTDAFTEQMTKRAQETQKTKESALDTYLKNLQEQKGLTQLTSEAYAQQGGVDALQVELNDINDQIRQEQRGLELAKRAITEKGGGLATGAAAEIANLERISLQKQADLSVIQLARQQRYDSAKAVADRAVDAQLEQQKTYNDTLRFMYDEAKADWTTAEQREFETLLDNRNRALEDERTRLKEIKDFALSALQAGASVSETQQMMSAKTLDEAMAIGGSYLRPKPKAAAAPDVKNFGTADNPNWGYIDPATNTFVPVSGLGATGAGAVNEAQKGLDQVRFLRGTISDAQGLVNATGPNLISQGLGKVFVGNTKANQLANKIDTLKTNLLALNTDPNLRKFFGPQMTEKDTQLLMSAGSTLDAYSNSVEDNKQELARYETLLKKIEDSLSNAATTPVPQGPVMPEQIVTAPDGREYYFTD